MEALLVVGLFFLCYFLVVYGFYLRRKVMERRSQKTSVIDDLFEMQDMMGQKEAIDGKIPEGVGQFGYSKQNPIPVKGVLGEIYYLSRLYTLDNKKVKYNRKGSTISHNINKPIDRYEITVDGANICSLYLCPYYSTNSDVSPEGFNLVELGELKRK